MSFPRLYFKTWGTALAELCRVLSTSFPPEEWHITPHHDVIRDALYRRVQRIAPNHSPCSELMITHACAKLICAIILCEIISDVQSCEQLSD